MQRLELRLKRQSRDKIKIQIRHGMCQGNGAALAAWLTLSSILVRVYKSLGVVLDIMGVLYMLTTRISSF